MPLLLHDTWEAPVITHRKRETLANLRCMGKGPKYVKIRNRVYYSEQSVAEWLSARDR